ncbi:MAG: hypothetical protein L0241_14940 [Planctomycetia bacterium]|nr:hypothetical protein [Planctomycetia bacterium]
MRTVCAGIVLLAAAALTTAQDPVEPQPRYGITPRVKLYPQSTPKETLKTALELIDKGEYGYFVAHLLDPKFVDERVADRAKLFEPPAEAELTKLRDFQQANLDKIAPEDRLPLDPKQFRARVAARANDRAFRQVLKDIEEKFTDDPQSLKDLRKILREDKFPKLQPTDITSQITINDRTLFFKKIDDRWYMENRQTEDKKKDN